MKETIAWIIGKYGTEKLRYALIVFGANAKTELDFDSSTKTPNNLIEFVQLLRMQPGRSNIIGALKKAEEVFDSENARPDACKVVVIMTDKAFRSSAPEISEAAAPLDEREVKVIPVAVGFEDDSSQLELTNPDGLVIEVPRSEKPRTLGKQLMEHVTRCKLKRKRLCMCFRLSVICLKIRYFTYIKQPTCSKVCNLKSKHELIFKRPGNDFYPFSWERSRSFPAKPM